MNKNAIQQTFQRVHSAINKYVWLLVEHGISKPINNIIDQGEDDLSQDIGFGKRIFLYVQNNQEESNKRHILKVLKS